MTDNFNADATMFLRVIFIMFRNYRKFIIKKYLKSCIKMKINYSEKMINFM